MEKSTEPYCFMMKIMSDKLNYVALLLLFLFVGVFDAAAQVKHTKEQRQLKKRSDYYYSYGDYLNAQVGYKKLLLLDTSSKVLIFRIGICTMITNDGLSASTRTWTRMSRLSPAKKSPYSATCRSTSFARSPGCGSVASMSGTRTPTRSDSSRSCGPTATYRTGPGRLRSSA